MLKSILLSAFQWYFETNHRQKLCGNDEDFLLEGLL